MRQQNTNEFIVQLPGRDDVRIILRRNRARKQTMLSVHKNGEVILKAPDRITAAALQKFVMSKTDWLIAALRKIETSAQQPPPIGIRLLGKDYPIQIETSALLHKHGFAELVDDIFYLHMPSKLTPAKEKAAKKLAIQTWYRKMAAEIFAERATLYAAQIGVQYTSIKLADPKSRWGSCGADGRLMFSWRAVMCPLEILDYLIVHELCHLVHFNHSKAYWQTVERILPDYKTRRAELRNAEGSVKNTAF